MAGLGVPIVGGPIGRIQNGVEKTVFNNDIAGRAIAETGENIDECDTLKWDGKRWADG